VENDPGGIFGRVLAGCNSWAIEIFDRAHKDYDQFIRWAGGHFQAEEFDVTAVNENLHRCDGRSVTDVEGLSEAVALVTSSRASDFYFKARFRSFRLPWRAS
jgi:hypothetical protein